MLTHRRSFLYSNPATPYKGGIMETIIKDKIIKGDLICDGKLIFAAGLGKVNIEGQIRAQSIEIKEGTYIYSGGHISSDGDIYSDKDIYSGGYIYSGGHIYSGGNIYFSYHLIFKTKITCKLLRLSSNSEIERRYWIEKFNLFGFKKIAKQISTGCVQEIQPIFADKKTAARLLKCKYFTKLEKLIIKSWHKGELKGESLYGKANLPQD